jgi:predicted GNAT superfamily acetyltransferase
MGVGPAVAVSVVTDVEEAARVVDLFGHVWATGGDPLVRRELAWALAVSGAYLASATLEGRVVGASLGWLGIDDGEVALHSHLTAVDSAVRGTGVGLALKRHQRAWCLERDVDRVRWTFDPAVRRNAWFNLSKLGATIVDYAVDFYGPLDDAINAGDDSDRAVVTWDLRSAAAEAAARGVLEPPDADRLQREGATVILTADADGTPREGDPLQATTAALCATPADVETLRRARPDVARSWRRALRSGLGSALERGWRVTGISRDGWYVLEPAEGGP